MLAVGMVALAAAAVYAAVTLCVVCSPGPDRKHVLESFETPTAPKIRVLVHPQRAFLGGGPYFRFESQPPSSADWREVATFVHDSVPGPIPQQQIRRVTDEIAFFFIGWLCAVTADGGHSWAVWRADRDLPNWQCCNYGLIQDIIIREDGSGTMICAPLEGHAGEIPRLDTNDFGRTWHATKI